MEGSGGLIALSGLLSCELLSVLDADMYMFSTQTIGIAQSTQALQGQYSGSAWPRCPFSSGWHNQSFYFKNVDFLGKSNGLVGI